MQTFRNWKTSWLVIVGTLALLIQGLSAINRGAHGKSDLSVFYRTAVLLAEGAGGALYAQRDVALGWYRCIPPAGMMWFAPLTALSPRGASVIWTLFNLGLAVLGAFALKAILEAIGREDPANDRMRVVLPLAIGLFFFMGSSSVQVGQYSLMFVTLWLVALWFAVRHKLEGTALALALPASIKIYPALLLLVPLGVLKLPRWPRFVIAFALGCALWTWAVPALFYGGRTVELESSFWHEIVLSPQGRLSESQSVSSTSNHGLDTVLLRFGSNLPEPHGAPPHLNFAPHTVLSIVNPLRLLFILAAIGLWWRRYGRNGEARQWLDSAALWSATLFLILPGAKSRYAVYAFIAFIPLLLRVAWLFETKAPRRWLYTGFIVVVSVLVMSLVPTQGRLWGAGFWGALLLWIENGNLLLRPQEGTPIAPLNREQPIEDAAMLRAQ